jgi:hypothetical protein
MSKRILALLMVISLLVPSFAALKGLEVTKEESLVKVGENINVPEGAEVKTVVAVGGSVTVAGKVVEDVVAIGGNISLSKSAIVGGDVVVVGGTVNKDPNAIIRGNITEVKMPTGMITKGLGWGLAIFSVLSFLAFLVLAIIIVGLFDKQLGITSYYIERLPGHALLWGILAGLLVVPLIILMVISIIGIPFIPVLAIILAAAGVFGYIAASQLIGKLFLRAVRVYNKPMVWEIVSGLIILFILSFLPILGWIVKALVGIMGLGAIIATRFGTQG